MVGVGLARRGAEQQLSSLNAAEAPEALPETRLGEAPGVPGLGCLKLQSVIFNQFPNEQIVPGTTLRDVDVGKAVRGYFCVQWWGLRKATEGEEHHGEEEGKCG